MVRKHSVFCRKIQFFLKYLFLSVSIGLFTIWGQGNLPSVGVSPIFASTPAEIAQCFPNELGSYAQCLTQQGHVLLNEGKPEEALKTWEQAIKAYTQLNDAEGIIGSQINHSLALQALGQYRRACQILAPAMKLDYQNNQVCKQTNETEQSSQTQLAALTETLTKQEDSPVRAIALRTLGDVLRVVGNLDYSEVVLKESLAMTKRLQLSPDISANLFSLANTDRALYNRALDLYDRTDSTSDRDKAITKVEASLDGYREAAKQANNLSTSKITLIQAKLNHLSLLLEFKPWLEEESKKADMPHIREQLSGIQPQIQSQVDELLNDPSLFSGLPPIPAVYARLNLAQNLSKLKQKDKLPAAIQYTKDALQQTKNLEIQREEAYALGILGNLYDLSNQLSMAQQSTEEALGLAQSIQAWDIAYQWQQQLGRIYEKNGKIKEAIAAYNSAVNTLDRVRQDLLTINPDVQFSFRENVKPVYGDLMRLLLQEPNQNNLNKVLEVNERLQLAELENFLQCGSLNLVSLNQTFNKLDKPPAIIHTIVLDEAIEVVVKSPQKPLHRHRISLKEVEIHVNSISETLQIENLKPKNINEIMPNFQALYQLLIAPAKSYLPDNGTLVFVLDSSLQNIPMALLQDENNHYLVEKYSIALSLGSRVREPKFLPWKESRVLIAGLSEATEGFKALINVPLELQQVGETTVSKQVLLDKRFTLENFQNELNASAFSIIHLATHGVFSSDPEKTFILASNGKINVRQFDRLLRSKTQGSRDTIELLVLSACQTAKGDKRAGLGIAGVAVQAGARSTIASLWNVSDRSTALFMSEFYQQLKAGKTKAESLREAQLALLKNPPDPRYANPYYWAPFILAGNWL